MHFIVEKQLNNKGWEKMLNKLKEKIKERHLWKDYIATNKVAEALGELTGSRPYFMSFDEYKKQRADEENTITIYSKKSVGLKEGIALKAKENKEAKEPVQKIHTQTWKSSKYGWIEVTGTDEQFITFVKKYNNNSSIITRLWFINKETLEVKKYLLI